MKHTKLLAALLCAVMVLALAACGQAKTDAPAASGTSSAPRTPMLRRGFVQL